MCDTQYTPIQHIVSTIKNAEKPNFRTQGVQESRKALGFTRSLVNMPVFETVSVFSDLYAFGGIRSTQPTM